MARVRLADIRGFITGCPPTTLHVEIELAPDEVAALANRGFTPFIETMLTMLEHYARTHLTAAPAPTNPPPPPAFDTLATRFERIARTVREESE